MLTALLARTLSPLPRLFALLRPLTSPLRHSHLPFPIPRTFLPHRLRPNPTPPPPTHRPRPPSRPVPLPPLVLRSFPVPFRSHFSPLYPLPFPPPPSATSSRRPRPGPSSTQEPRLHQPPRPRLRPDSTAPCYTPPAQKTGQNYLSHLTPPPSPPPGPFPLSLLTSLSSPLPHHPLPIPSPSPLTTLSSLLAFSGILHPRQPHEPPHASHPPNPPKNHPKSPQEFFGKNS